MPVASKTKQKTAQDPTRAFFGDLAAREHEPFLKDAAGTLRFAKTPGGWRLAASCASLRARRAGKPFGVE